MASQRRPSRKLSSNQSHLRGPLKRESLSSKYMEAESTWPESIFWRNRKTPKCPLRVYRGKISKRGRGFTKRGRPFVLDPLPPYPPLPVQAPRTPHPCFRPLARDHGGGIGRGGCNHIELRRFEVHLSLRSRKFPILAKSLLSASATSAAPPRSHMTTGERVCDLRGAAEVAHDRGRARLRPPRRRRGRT